MSAGKGNAFELRTGGGMQHLLMVAPVNAVVEFAIKSSLELNDDALDSPGLLLSESAMYEQLSSYLKKNVLMIRSNPALLAELDAGLTIAQLIIANTLPLFVELLVAGTTMEIPGNYLRHQQLIKQVEGLVLNTID